MNRTISQFALLSIPASEVTTWLKGQVPILAPGNGSPTPVSVIQAYESLELQSADGHPLVRFNFSQTQSGHTLVRGEAADSPHVATFFAELWALMRSAFANHSAANNGSVANGRAETSGYGPNPATLVKLERLHALRRQSILNNHVTISWTAACRQIAIDPKTVRQYDPQLRAHWDDPNYQ